MSFLSKRGKKITIFSYIVFIIFATFTSPKLASAQNSSPLIIECARYHPREDSTDQYCDNINALLRQAIRIAEYLMGIAGSLALLVFIYGGFTMLTSFGKADRFKQGRKALIAAAAGLAITFGAYIIVGFVLDALGVEQSFRAINSLQ